MRDAAAEDAANNLMTLQLANAGPGQMSNSGASAMTPSIGFGAGQQTLPSYMDMDDGGMSFDDGGMMDGSLLGGAGWEDIEPGASGRSSTRFLLEDLLWDSYAGVPQ